MNERIWVSVSIKELDQDMFEQLTVEGFEEQEPNKYYRLRMNYKTLKRSEACRLVQVVQEVVQEFKMDVTVQAITQPVCTSCNSLNRFSAESCYKCGSPVTEKRDILQELSQPPQVVNQPVQPDMVRQ